jgi:hypothetical protein
MITDSNYYKPNNKALTNSKIKDFIKDKHFFKRKHLLGEVAGKKTDALIIGSAVDCWLTEGKERFDLLYSKVDRRKKDADDYEYQLTETMYDEICGICQSVEQQDAYKELKGYKKQQIIQVEMDLGEHFDRLCGKPDWYKIFKNEEGRTVCTIIDLKTTADASERKYLYSCFDYGYFEQQAQYQNILALLHPEIDEFYSFHLVVEKDTDDIYNCEVFELAQDRIERDRVKMQSLYEQIKNEKDFAKKNVSLAHAKLIGSLAE